MSKHPQSMADDPSGILAEQIIDAIDGSHVDVALSALEFVILKLIVANVPGKAAAIEAFDRSTEIMRTALADHWQTMRDAYGKPSEH